jgi:hypothetical protein
MIVFPGGARPQAKVIGSFGAVMGSRSRHVLIVAGASHHSRSLHRHNHCRSRNTHGERSLWKPTHMAIEALIPALT